MTSEYKFRMLSYPLEVNVATREFIENTEAYNFIRHGLENIGIKRFSSCIMSGDYVGCSI